MMDSPSLPYVCSAATLARTLLESWLSGDRFRLRAETEFLSKIPDSAIANDEDDTARLVKDIAIRLNDSPEMLSAADPAGIEPADPQAGAWLSLLGHLSARSLTPSDLEPAESSSAQVMYFRSEYSSARRSPLALH